MSGGRTRQWSVALAMLAQRLRLRLARPLAFIQARLSPHSYLGLELTMGALSLLGAAWLFGGVAEEVVQGEPLTLLDVQVAQWFHEYATPSVTRFMLAVTHLHDPVVMTGAVLLLAGFLAVRRNRYWLICLGLIMPGGMLLNVLMKHAFARSRPSFEHPLLVASSYSFPSGHMAGATLLYGLLAALLVTHVTAWRWRVLIVLAAAALALLVGLTRIYLGVHYLSDVLAAAFEALAWLALCLTGMNTFWQHRAARRGAPVRPKRKP